jgi:PAS domain S-box
MDSDLLNAFEEAFPDTGFVFNEDAVVVRTFAGPEVDLLVGNRNEPIVGKSVDDVFESSIAEEIQLQIAATLDRQELQTKEYVIEVETGARSFDARMAPVATNTGEQLVAALFRDVTTRDLYAQRLERKYANSVDDAASDAGCESGNVGLEVVQLGLSNDYGFDPLPVCLDCQLRRRKQAPRPGNRCAPANRRD